MLHDVAIVGAGPVGATLALALADSDLDVVVLDARPAAGAARGDRSLALSHGTCLVLERCGVWAELAASPDAVTPIVTIDVSQSGGFGATRLEAAEFGLAALGYVVRYQALQAALDAAMQRARILVRYGAVARSVGGTSVYAAIDLEAPGQEPVLARLAAVADGSDAVRGGGARTRVDYHQVALVARLQGSRPHHGIAYERFTPDGPIALLPEGKHYGLVWTVAQADAERVLALDGADFLAELATRIGPGIGTFHDVCDRRAFPLALEFATRTTGVRQVRLGNAAQTLHPVGGQGFNLGLRDAYALARVLVDTPREAIGSPEMLRRYARGRRLDRWAGIAFTHGLVRSFGTDRSMVKWPRGLALAALDTLLPVKHAFVRALLHGLR